MANDDLKHVVSFGVRRPRRIEDPASIRQLVENMVQACSDLDLRIFCWTRNPHPMNYRAHDPFHFTVTAAEALGFAGKDLLPDSRLVAFEDVDLSMRCLLRHRVILCDNRYFWVFGRCWVGRGGNQGIRRGGSGPVATAVGAVPGAGVVQRDGYSKTKNTFGIAVREVWRSAAATPK